MARRKVVVVHWIDSCSWNQWNDVKKHEKHTNSNCVTSGFLLRKDNKNVVVSGSLDSNDNATLTIAIPRVAVKKITTVADVEVPE